MLLSIVSVVLALTSYATGRKEGDVKENAAGYEVKT